MELVPPEITALKQIQKHAARRNKSPTEILLDQTHHGQAMIRLEGYEKRGRPDIIFLSLMTILETPLCKEGLLSIHLHLLDGTIVQVNPKVRLPRNYDRFVGLFEQLLLNGQVPPDGTPLLKILNQDLFSLISNLKGTHQEFFTVLAKDGGNPTGISELENLFPSDLSIPVIVGIGAFPHGDFSESVLRIFEKHLEFDAEVMMAWHVCAEVLWTYTHKFGVVKKRCNQKTHGIS